MALKLECFQRVSTSKKYSEDASEIKIKECMPQTQLKVFNTNG